MTNPTNKLLFALVLIVGALSCFFLNEESLSLFVSPQDKLRSTNWMYKNWKEEHKFKFGESEDRFRYDVFQKNLMYITTHNSNPKHSYKLGLNQFAGLTNEEFAATFLGNLQQDVPQTNVSYLEAVNLSAAVDWTKKGAVTPVKYQGQCGSCWAFSATGAIEGLRVVKGGKLWSFSEQQLLDCSWSYGNYGCNGGLAISALRYVSFSGIVQDSDYPYIEGTQQCKIPAKAEKYKINGYSEVPKNSVSQLQAALNRQPVAVSVKADGDEWRFYKSGIMDNDKCGTKVNHAVLAVGYGSQNKTNYIKVKNSWGERWGDAGYILIAMKDGPGVCGINTQSSYPIA